MTLARIINNAIEIYNQSKSSIIDIHTGKLITGWNYAKEAKIAQQGFVEPVVPEYDATTHQLGGLLIVDNVITYQVVEKPVPIKIFDTVKANDDLINIFTPRITELDKRYSIVDANLNPILTDKNKKRLHGYAYTLKEEGSISEDEYNAFLNIFTSQGEEFDITIYTI